MVGMCPIKSYALYIFTGCRFMFIENSHRHIFALYSYLQCDLFLSFFSEFAENNSLKTTFKYTAYNSSYSPLQRNILSTMRNGALCYSLVFFPKMIASAVFGTYCDVCERVMNLYLLIIVCIMDMFWLNATTIIYVFLY